MLQQQSTVASRGSWGCCPAHRGDVWRLLWITSDGGSDKCFMRRVLRPQQGSPLLKRQSGGLNVILPCCIRSCSGFLPAERESLLPLLLTCGQALGFYKAPRDNLDCNRSCINKVELNARTLRTCFSFFSVRSHLQEEETANAISKPLLVWILWCWQHIWPNPQDPSAAAEFSRIYIWPFKQLNIWS